MLRFIKQSIFILVGISLPVFLGCAGGSGDSAGVNEGGTAVVDSDSGDAAPTVDVEAKLAESNGDMISLFETEPAALAAYIGDDADKLKTLNEQLKNAHVERSKLGVDKSKTTDKTVEEGGDENVEFKLGDLVPLSDDEFPDLETLIKENEWIDKPVRDPLADLRERQASEPAPELSVEEALQLKNNSLEINRKIIEALGRVAPKDGKGADFEATWNRHTAGGAGIKSTNPLMASSTAEFEVASLTNFGLFSFDAKFVPFASKDAVVSWQTSKDGIYDKIVMRDDLTWSDGEKITAHDIEFSYKVIMTSKVPVPAMRAGTDKIRGVKAYDDHTLVYVHPSSLATNVWNVNFSVIPKHVYADSIADDPTLQSSPHHIEKDENPVTGGSYVIKKRVRGQEIVLERRESAYMHEGKQVRNIPYFKTIRFRIIEDPNTALLSLKKGDIEEMTLTPEQWKESTTTDDFYGKNTKARDVEWVYFYFGWNLRSPFFRDVRVRKAMGYAFNHAELMERHRKGMDEQAAGSFHHTSPWAPIPMPEPYQQDLDKAEDLLAEAGWEDTDGDGILDGYIFTDPEFDGQLNGVRRQKFEFTILVSNRQDRIAIAELLRENLDQIGIVCNVSPLDFTVMQQRSRDHKFHASFAGWGTGADPDTSENLWTTRAIDSGRNYCCYSNPEIDQLFEDGKRELDPEKRRKIYQQIHLKLYEDQAYTWLFYRNAYYAFNKTLRGYNFSPRGPYSYGPGQGAIFKAAGMQ